MFSSSTASRTRWLTDLAERRPQHQRVPVLHHDRADAVPRQEARRLRQGRRRARRREEDGGHQDGLSWQGRAEHGRRDRAVRRDVSCR